MVKHIQTARKYSSILTIGGLVLIINELFPDLTGETVSFCANVGALALISLGLIGLTFFVKCPECGERLTVYSIKNNSFTDWLNWVFQAKECPSCKCNFYGSIDSNSE